MPTVMVEKLDQLVDLLQAQKCSTAMFQRWDGVSWSRGVVPPELPVDAQGIGDGSNAFVLGGRSWNGYPTNTTSVLSSGSIFLEGQSSASFGLLTFVSASGNAKSLQSQLPYSTNPAFNVLTGSGQIGFLKSVVRLTKDLNSLLNKSRFRWSD